MIQVIITRDGIHPVARIAIVNGLTNDRRPDYGDYECTLDREDHDPVDITFTDFLRARGAIALVREVLARFEAQGYK